MEPLKELGKTSTFEVFSSLGRRSPFTDGKPNAVASMTSKLGFDQGKMTGRFEIKDEAGRELILSMREDTLMDLLNDLLVLKQQKDELIARGLTTYSARHLS